MKKILLLISLALFISPAFAKWNKVGVSEDGQVTLYYNDSQFTRNGKFVKMWKLYDFKSPRETYGKFYLSSVDLGEYDCSQNTMRIISMNSYAGNMGTGEMVLSEKSQMGWQDIPPETVGEKYLRVACSKK